MALFRLRLYPFSALRPSSGDLHCSGALTAQALLSLPRALNIANLALAATG